MADKDEREPTIEEDIVVTKYSMAGEIANRVLQKVIDGCVADAVVLDLCKQGDSLLQTETDNVYKKEKNIKKGIAFPTCISVNNTVCHFSPMEDDPAVVLKDGDLVKIDLGAHVDGFPAMVAHTLVVGASKDKKVSGRAADVILAAHYASELALRLLKPGNENYQVTDALQKVAEDFECKPIEGMLSYRLQQHKIDGEALIIQNPTDYQKKEHKNNDFKVFEVYAMDVLISTGEGKGREKEARPTVYKKTEEVYSLKLKSARQFLNEVSNKYGNMPFTLRACAEATKAKMGIIENVKHGVMEPFTVLYEKEGEFVAQFKFTVLLLASGSKKITGLLNKDLPEIYESQFSVKDEELKTLLATSVSSKAAKKKKKKAAKAMTDAAGEVTAES